MIKKLLKSIWFWLATLPLWYLAFGFLLLPWLIQSQGPKFLKEHYNLNLSLEQISFNPLSYELHLNNLSLNTDAHTPVIRLKHLYVDYAPSLLFKKELFFHTILIEEPWVAIERDSNGTLNLLSLFSGFAASADTNTTEHSSGSLPLRIGNFEIKDAGGSFTDVRPAPPFVFEFGPMQYSINHLSFDKDDLSIHALKVALQNQDKITLASSISFDPLKIHGQININQLPLPSLWAYFLPTMPAKLSQGAFTTQLPFTLDLSKETPELAIEKASLALDAVAFTSHDQQPLVAFNALHLDDITVFWPQAKVSLGTLRITEPSVHVSLEKGYEPNLAKLFTPPNSPKAEASKEANPLPWQAVLKTLIVEQGRVEILDKNAKNSKTSLSNVSLNVENISNDLNQSIRYDMATRLDNSGSLSLKGSFNPLSEKLETSLKAQALSLAKLQPYLEPYTPLTLKKGALSTTATLAISLKKSFSLLFKGDVTLDGLDIHDTSKKSLVSWEKLLLSEVLFNTEPSMLHIKKINLNKPYANLDIHKDKSTNFSDTLKTSSAPPPKASSGKDKAMEIRIGDVTLKNGRAHFKDASLPIPFATLIHNLNGSFSTLDTKNAKPSVLKLEGKVDKYGYSKISGSLLPFDFKDRANLKILFKNIDMPSLTPYSGKFIGYAIQKGKLSMDLSYNIKKGLMQGDNKINLDSLTLGEKIESEEATSLPLGLAIAILKDSKGQIDIDLPVSGDLNDPDFKYGALVWKAIGNLLGSIITSPFNLIGSLLGIETETLKSIDFAAGEFEIIASEEEKMEQYKQILEKKPELKLSITPSFNEALDTLGLQENAVDAQIEAMTKNSKQGEDTYTKALKELFITRSSKEAYADFISAQEEEKRERGAINEALKSKIATTFRVSPEDLERLATKRADAIIQMMTQKFGIPSTKLTKSPAQPSDALREKWVGCSVSIGN